mmetsp:Transcript_25371/g.51551  ORF Transcript_25371/g.51551 Transcript_25371/m.51551 type:complete len:223 (+) Transcript_25371:111-779(+)
MSIVDWVQRCSMAQEAGSPFPEASLLRAVVDHTEWTVSADQQDAYTAGAAPSHLEVMSGLELAAALPAGGLLRLHHAPGAKPLTLGPALVAHLQLFVQIRVVENILSRLHRGEELSLSAPCARLRDFDSYWVVQQGSMLALAPDVHRRRLAAAFTAEDGLQQFVAARDAVRDEQLIAARLSGVELFGRLAEAELDGVVFNPAGPGSPVPLAKAVAALVLTAP